MAARGSAPVGGSAPFDISDAFVTPTSSLSTERFASHRDWEPKNAPLCHCGLSVQALLLSDRLQVLRCPVRGSDSAGLRHAVFSAQDSHLMTLLLFLHKLPKRAVETLFLDI